MCNVLGTRFFKQRLLAAFIHSLHALAPCISKPVFCIRSFASTPTSSYNYCPQHPCFAVSALLTNTAIETGLCLYPCLSSQILTLKPSFASAPPRFRTTFVNTVLYLHHATTHSYFDDLDLPPPRQDSELLYTWDSLPLQPCLTTDVIIGLCNPPRIVS